MLDLLRVGVRLAFSSGVPTAPFDPQKVIEAACHRPYRTDQTFAPLAALWASTRAALSVGQLVDLVLIASPGKVLLTVLGGRIIFSC